MIHLLAEYCRQLKLVAEPGFGPKLVRWAICCDVDGLYTGLVELGDVNAKKNSGQEFPCCPDLSQGELIADGGSRSHFLADTANVVLLLAKNADDPKLIAKHEFFRDLVQEASSSVPLLLPAARLLCDAAAVEAIRQDCTRYKVKPTDRVTFRIGSAVPLEQDLWHDWWREFRRRLSAQEAPLNSGASAGSAPFVGKHRCFVTGEFTEPERTHLKISGLTSVGGQPAGDVLIGFDKDAFCSFGFSQGANASISAAGMASYRAGLNELLKRSSVRVGNARVAFWFKDRVEDTENPLWALLGAPSRVEDLAARERAIEFLRSVPIGRIRPLEGNRYYALTVSGAGGRVMVRGWMEGSFESLASAIAGWFDDLRITSRTGDTCAPLPSLDRLSYDCLSLRNQRSKDQKQTDDERRRFSQSLLHSALTGARLSDVLPLRILSCLRPELSSADTGQEDAPLQPNRFAVLRSYLVRFFRERGDISMSDAISPALNPALPSAAYNCGRVLAILAALQKRALGAVGAGVIQRYYASASTNPGLVFGRLIKNAQYHIEKLGPDKSGFLESLLAQTMTCVSPKGFPQVLSLQEQGLFGLGYYHQIADLRKKRIVTDDPDTPQEETASDESTN
jgi:CRISPR-associated protein Csd1